MPERAGLRLTDNDMALLQRVANDDVTWRNDNRGNVYRCWSSEYDNEIVTPRAKRLLAAGLIERRGGSYLGYKQGFVVLTDAGKAALSRPSVSGDDEAPASATVGPEIA